MTPQELISSGKPYIHYGDQYISTDFWPNPKCDCKGLGYYGMLAPQVLPEKLPIGVNSKCPCNSGKKYKKCCQSRIERLQQSGYRILTCHCLGKAELAENEFIENMKKEMKETLEKSKEAPQFANPVAE